MKRYIDINIDVDELTKEEAIEIVKKKRLCYMKNKVVSLINKIIKELKKLNIKIQCDDEEILPIDLLENKVLHQIHSIFEKRIDEEIKSTFPDNGPSDLCGYKKNCIKIESMLNINLSIEDIYCILTILEKADKPIDSIRAQLEKNN